MERCIPVLWSECEWCVFVVYRNRSRYA